MGVIDGGAVGAGYTSGLLGGGHAGTRLLPSRGVGVLRVLRALINIRQLQAQADSPN